MTTSQPRDPAPDATPFPEPEEPAATAFLPPPPRHRWGFGAFLLVEATLLASAAFVSVLVGDTGPGPLPMRVVLLGTMLPTTIAAGVAVLVTYVRGNGPVTDLRLEWRWADVKTGVRYGCVGLVFTTLGAYLRTQLVGNANATSAISEYDTRGHLVFDARFAGPDSSYRAYRFRWSATPAAPPDLSVASTPHGTRVYVSWNGATGVASWRIFGGRTAAVLRPLRVVSNQGFETSIAIRPETFVAVEALDRSGRTLGRSSVVRST